MDKYYLYDFEEKKLSKELDNYLITFKHGKTQLVAMVNKKDLLNNDFLKNISEFIKKANM